MLRCMKRNKRYKGLWYALFIESDELTEEKDGYTVYTGDRGGKYSDLVYLDASIQPKTYAYNSDSTITKIFGTDLNYDKIMILDWTEKATKELNEYAKLWIDVEPYIDGVLQPHDYEVKRIEIMHDRSAYIYALGRVSRNDEFRT